MPDAGGTGPAWVADPSIAWRILLVADLVEPLPAEVARARLARLHEEQGWPGTGRVVAADDLPALRAELGGERDGVVSLGLARGGHQVLVAADHAAVDGLGLLTVLARVTGEKVVSSARGVGDRPDRAGALGTVVRRLAEVVAHPPARIVVPPGAQPGDPRDVYVARDVPGEVRTADLVVAATRAVLAHNRVTVGPRRPRGGDRRVAVAVGVARDTTADPVADRSALLRLRDAERLDRDAVAAALRDAPTQRPPQRTGGRRVGDGVLRLGLRVLAPRLGSTILVSHLGRVRADGVTAMTFHPVTAGGSGVSLGAVSLQGGAPAAATRVSLRARGSRWTHDGLEQLLEAVVDALG